MGLVFFLAAVLWGIGWVLGARRQARWAMVAVLLGVVVALQLILVDGHPVRAATGGTPALWFILLGAGGIAVIYSRGVRALKTRAIRANGETQLKQETSATAPKKRFSEKELDRYARHIVLREIGGAGQKALRDASVLVVGAGGLGAPALQYLAAAGVGTIGVIDDDVVDNGNLQRQVIHRDDAIGQPKVQSAQAAMLAQNPYITVRPYQRRLNADVAVDLFSDYDIILDGSDNFDTRYLCNRVAVDLGLPLVSGALAQWEGQISVFDPARGAPCYCCIFPKAPAAHLAPSCSEAGVIGPLPGVIGSMMAVETVKLITGAGAPLRGAMLIYDALYGETRRISLSPRGDCPVCGG
jgi:molybdopterin/thiamine biosynthesis adenylyltransferase